MVNKSEPPSEHIFKEGAHSLVKRERSPPKRHVVEHQMNDIAVWEVYYDAKGRYHRTSDRPAVIERDEDTGVVTREEYYEHGRLHRECRGDVMRPAVIVRDPMTGLVTRAAGYVHGRFIGVTRTPDLRYDRPRPSCVVPR